MGNLPVDYVTEIISYPTHEDPPPHLLTTLQTMAAIAHPEPGTPAHTQWREANLYFVIINRQNAGRRLRKQLTDQWDDYCAPTSNQRETTA